jgi:hypothetical protein
MENNKSLHYLCRDEDGNLFVTVSAKDLTKYIGKGTRIGTGDKFYNVLQVITIK